MREIGKYLQIDNVEELLENPVREAVATIVQAAQEGLLANGQQAALVLAQVLNVLAPPGSQEAKAIGGRMPEAQGEADIARQMGRMM